MDLQDIFVDEKMSTKNVMRIIDRSGLQIAFVVDGEKRLEGIITDGDIRRKLLKGLDLKTSVKNIMNKSPMVIYEDWDNNKINNYLESNEISEEIPKHGSVKIPVIDKDKKICNIIFASKNRVEFYKHPTIKKSKKEKKVKFCHQVLVVGGAGYLGSILCRKLLKKGYLVRVLDNLTYGDHGIKELYENPNFEFIKGDMRDIQTVVDSVKDVDAVIHLAAIVGDPASALDPEETIEINYFGTRMLAEICKYSQINRFVFASTCSVYGASPTPDTKIKEESQLNPVSLYAEMKLKSEQGILELADGNFSPTILRMSTLYGLSPRMRFDLVVNTLTIKALMEKEFTIFGGRQWRPNLHVSDAADAYIKCLESPIESIDGEIFNVGSNEENYKIIQIGKTIKDDLPETEMKIDETKIDERNYNVSFDKIEKQLKYFTNFTIKDGIEEIKEAVVKGNFTDYKNNKYNNYAFLQNSNLQSVME